MALSDTDQLPHNFQKTVVAMRGFGSKNEQIAIYVEGVLFSLQETRFLDEDSDCYVPLAREFAKRLGYRWLERTAASVWAQSFYDKPPKKLSQYAALTRERFRQLSLFDIYDRHSTAPYGLQRGEERHKLYQVFVDCGGDPRREETWSQEFVASQGGDFETVNAVDFALSAAGVRHASPEVKLLSEQAWQRINQAWNLRLRNAIVATKPRSVNGRHAPTLDLPALNVLIQRETARATA